MLTRTPSWAPFSLNAPFLDLLSYSLGLSYHLEKAVLSELPYTYSSWSLRTPGSSFSKLPLPPLLAPSVGP